jgi:hypothetical protein
MLYNHIKPIGFKAGGLLYFPMTGRGGQVMNKELYVENASFGAHELGANRIISRMGQIVSVRLVIDPETGLKRWQAFVEMALKLNEESANRVKGVSVLAKALVGVWKRHFVLLSSLFVITGILTAFGVSFSQAPARRAMPVAKPVAKPVESEIDREIRQMMEKGINLKERRRQVTGISAAFARRTDPQRARRLAALCYLKTLGTPIMPIDIAVIALAETGEFGLSGKAVSPKGALGVWQLMPYRAMSHGYSPSEMKNDEKCAEAAVRELTSKMKMAKGNMVKAKKLYCGTGPAADAYAARIRQYKREILDEMVRIEQKRGVVGKNGIQDYT